MAEGTEQRRVVKPKRKGGQTVGESTKLYDEEGNELEFEADDVEEAPVDEEVVQRDDDEEDGEWEDEDNEDDDDEEMNDSSVTAGGAAGQKKRKEVWDESKAPL